MARAKKTEQQDSLPDGAAEGVAPVLEAKAPPRFLYKVSGVYGHAERVVAADDEAGAWEEFKRLDGLLATASPPVIKRVEGATDGSPG